MWPQREQYRSSVLKLFLSPNLDRRKEQKAQINLLQSRFNSLVRRWRMTSCWCRRLICLPDKSVFSRLFWRIQIDLRKPTKWNAVLWFQSDSCRCISVWTRWQSVRTVSGSLDDSKNTPNTDFANQRWFEFTAPQKTTHDRMIVWKATCSHSNPVLARTRRQLQTQSDRSSSENLLKPEPVVWWIHIVSRLI